MLTHTESIFIENILTTTSDMGNFSLYWTRLVLFYRSFRWEFIRMTDTFLTVLIYYVFKVISLSVIIKWNADMAINLILVRLRLCASKRECSIGSSPTGNSQALICENIDLSVVQNLSSVPNWLFPNLHFIFPLKLLFFGYFHMLVSFYPRIQ